MNTEYSEIYYLWLEAHSKNRMIKQYYTVNSLIVHTRHADGVTDILSLE